MLKNVSLRHLIPLLFFSGSLLLVVFFYLVGLPSAHKQALELSLNETHTHLLSQQSRIIELLAENDPQKLNKEIYFTGTDPTIKRLIIIDEAYNILFANRSVFISSQLADNPIPHGDVQIPFPLSGATDVIVEPQPGSETLINGYAALRFERDGKIYNYTLIMVRDYSPLAKAISKVVALPSELLATLMLIVSILVVLLLRRHLDSRLSPLLEAASALAHGDTSARSNLKGADEFAEIGRSFDLMADRLERHHMELKDAKENAEKANIAKNNFLALMSHEIQTPLSGLLGFIDLLDGTKLDEEARLYVRSAKSATRTLSSLVGDLLETSRLEAGTIRVTNEVFCLNSLLQELVDSILPKAQQKGLQVRIRCDQDTPIWIDSDPRLFRQILINLIGNALQFTQKGQITVAVSAHSTSGPHVELNIQVIDTGIGIAPEDIPHIFDRFFKSTDPRAQASPGSGIGLTVCKQLATILGGKLTVKSALDQGTSFSFAIEAIKASPPNDFNYSILTQREQKAQNILLVESAEITRTLMRSILSKWGHDIIPCTSSADAIKEMRKRLINPDMKPITLIIIDLHSPGMNGFDTAQEIRALDAHYGNIPIIATSTQTDSTTINACLEAGFDGFIGKPIDRKKMADEVFRLTRLVGDRTKPKKTDPIEADPKEADTPAPQDLPAKD